MRTVLDETNSLQGRLQISHLHQHRSEPTIKLSASDKEARRRLQWSGQHEDLISKLQLEQQRRCSRTSNSPAPVMPDRVQLDHDHLNERTRNPEHENKRPDHQHHHQPNCQQLASIHAPNGTTTSRQLNNSNTTLTNVQDQPRVGRFQMAADQFQAYRTTNRNNSSESSTSIQIPAKPPPKIFPNNTIIEDLSKCHANLWPRVTRATSKSIELVKSCMPSRTPQAAKSPKSSIQSGFTIDLEQQRIEQPQQPSMSIYSLNNSRGPIEKTTMATDLNNQQIRMKSTNKLAPRKHHKRDCCKHKFQMPDSLLRLNTSLTQDDYNQALSILANDIRFQLHILFYGQLQILFVLMSSLLCLLWPTLMQINLNTTVILASCSIWILVQAAGILIVGQCRKKLDRMLERSVAQVNSYFMDNKLMLGVINVAGLFRESRLAIPLVYFNTFECIEQIESIVSADLKSIEANGKHGDNSSKGGDKPQKRQPKQQVALDYSKIGFNQMDPNQRAFAKSTTFPPRLEAISRHTLETNQPLTLFKSNTEQQLAKKIVLRFGQRWVSRFDRNKLLFTDETTKPRHLSTGKCLCQFIEEHLGGDQSEALSDLDEPLDNCDGDELKQQSVTNIEQTHLQQEQHPPTRQYQTQCNLEVYEILNQLAMRQLMTSDCEKSHSGLSKREILRALASFAAENSAAPLDEKTIAHSMLSPDQLITFTHRVEPS